MTLLEIKRALRNGKYAWPGGYPLYAVTSDGETLSFDAVRKHWRDVCQAHICHGWRNSGWRIIGIDINWEDGEMTCAETGDRIESAYAEPEGVA